MQKIYYGAPGTGKSREIDEKLKSLEIPEERIFRTTFHPEYNYSDFIGQLLPKVENTSENESKITYDFSKGIFTQALEKAYEDTSKDVYLVIEEMSRGNCAAIFGDIFQLLDRETKGVNRGYSKYFINNEVIAKDIIAFNDNKIKLPPKLHLLGTVNTSDQNVFVMDTAFKRRFDWSYVSTEPAKDENGVEINNPPIYLNKNNSRNIETNWVALYQKLNHFITSTKYLNLGEDKQLGHFFINFIGIEDDKIKKQIQDKLLQYLWEDVAKASFKRDVNLFIKEGTDAIENFETLYTKFENDEQVFNDKFLSLFE